MYQYLYLSRCFAADYADSPVVGLNENSFVVAETNCFVEVCMVSLLDDVVLQRSVSANITTTPATAMGKYVVA